MTWAHPLVVALAPVALFAAWWLVRRARRGDGPVFANIKRRWADRRGLSDRPVTGRRRFLRGFCLAAGAAAALLALARPQWGEIAEQSFDQSREVMLALDLSRSMLADDVAPSRLARAKLLISSLLDQLRGERVGLIVFSGTAFVQSPLSADYEVLRDFLDELDPSYLPEGGTDYEAMLRTAVQGFGAQGDGDRYLVVLSDGEALDEHWQTLIPELRERGIRVIGLGVGTPAGALVPDGRGGLVKDERGAAVLSRLEPRTLQELAAQTDGAYRDAATWVDIAELVDATVAQGRKGHYVEERNVRLRDHYQWFLAPAVLFVLLSFWLEFPVAPLARALQPRGRRPHPASAPVIAAALLGLAAWSLPGQASAAVPDTLPSPSGTASQPNQLTATVEALSNQPRLAPADYARLATDTIAFASQPSAPKDASRGAVIDDALAAVDIGEATDAHAADWKSLRQQLEQLRHVPEPPPQEQQRNQPQQDQQSGGGQQESQNGQGSSQKSDAQAAQGSDSQSSGASSKASKSDAPPPAAPAPPERRPPGGDPNAQAKSDADSNSQPPKSDADPNSGERRSLGAGAGGEEEKREDNTQSAGEVQRQDDVQPLDAPEAGLAEKHDGSKDAAEPPHAPGTRLVGGGRAMSGVEPQGETALADAVGKMERVKDGDAPAVLFDRMNRAEGQPRAPKTGKNW